MYPNDECKLYALSTSWLYRTLVSGSGQITLLDDLRPAIDKGSKRSQDFHRTLPAASPSIFTLYRQGIFKSASFLFSNV